MLMKPRLSHVHTIGFVVHCALISSHGLRGKKETELIKRDVHHRSLLGLLYFWTLAFDI